MGNIISYLRWRGDFTFRQMPFNEVNNLILSELAYLNLQDIVPDLEDGRRTFALASRSYRHRAGLYNQIFGNGKKLSIRRKAVREF